MERSYSWEDVSALGAGDSEFSRLLYGTPYRLEPALAIELAPPFWEQLSQDGFDLTRPIEIVRDSEMIDGFTFIQ